MLGLSRIDAQEWGPRLRFSAPTRVIETFYQTYETTLRPFVVYGSGDFHHLSALWLRRVTEPVVLVSFDNHPDWDVRPPRWCCGSWVNRALELPTVQRVSVWGCGNFECWWPGQVFGNRRAERSGRLEVHPWADDRPKADRARRGAIQSENWRERFAGFVQEIATSSIYVTIDLDCLGAQDAVTNWESGRFAVTDVIWALQMLRGRTRIVGGDICGAYSRPRYARWKQKFISEMDHPNLPVPDAEQASRINQAAMAALWPVLTQ
jgi:arginase family enzyme